MLPLLLGGAALALPAPDGLLSCTISSAPQEVTFSFGHLSGGPQWLIDWGDGSRTRGTGFAIQAHTYTSNDTYVIRVWGRTVGILGLSATVTADLGDLAGLTSLTSLTASTGSGATGTLADTNVFQALTNLSLFDNNTAVTGDLSDLTGFPALTSLSVPRVTTGELSDLDVHPLLETFTNSGGAATRLLTGDLADVLNRSGFRQLSISSNQVTAYAGGTLSSALQVVRIGDNDLDSTNLGALVDQIYAQRDTLVLNSSRIYDLTLNPGSAAVATSHSAEIATLNGMGFTVTI